MKTKFDLSKLVEKIAVWYLIIVGAIFFILGFIGYKFYSMDLSVSGIIMLVGIIKFILGWLTSIEIRIDALKNKEIQ